LTKSHKILAAKRRAKREQIKEVVFDDEARREFLTGFHKRKVQKKEAAKKKAQDREKQERLDARREKRQLLAERAAQNAAETEKAYGALVEESDGDTEWSGIVAAGPSPHKGKGKAKEEEYEYEEQVATVTVVEEFDPDVIIHGPNNPRSALDTDTGDHSHATSSESNTLSSHTRPQNNLHPGRRQKDGMGTGRSKTKPRVAAKPKDVKYQTNAARKADRMKQRRRKTEKAERAGGKASRRGAAAGRKKR